ncbi:MAG TPA: PAS domain S-box protein [Candidatus Aquilonibacter sp.]|nr:PAS domain S-box protein [Candidatus Aquilonibacter sp.]
MPSRAQLLPGSILAPGFLEIMPDAVVAVDAGGVIVQINAQAEALFGYEPGKLAGQKIEVLVPEGSRKQHRLDRKRFAGQPKIRRMGAGLDLSGRRKDGTEFPVEISLSPVSTKDGVLVLSAIRDISDRKKIEAELRQAHAELQRQRDRQLWDSENRLALIVDSSEDAIIGKTLEGLITSWNKGAERIYGYAPEEVLGRHISIISPKERSDEIPRILERIRRGESVQHFESVRVAKDGRRLNVSLSVSPIRDAEGEIVGASVIARNITEKKRAEEQLRQAQKMEAVGRLAGGLAHDFNNILGILSGCNELARDRIGAGSEASSYLDTMREAIQRGASLTRQLLAFSRRQVAQPEVMDLNLRLKETSKLLRPLMGDDVEIVIIRRSDQAIVEADPGQIDQIVLNLAVNARDAMPRGGRIILETAAVEFDEGFARSHPPMTAGKYVLLAVSDTGTGMDEATVPHIFEPFFTTKEPGKGTGLGLATVYGIVQQNGGHIWVYSEPGRGTTFKIHLPSAEYKLGRAPEAETQATPPRRQGTKILLVEDDNIMRRLTRQMLEEHGYAVIEAADGKSALQQVQDNPAGVDLVLTDVVMRGMSGPELVKRLTDTHPRTKALYMSGYTGELISEHELAGGNRSLLEKPFTRAALLKAVDEALR